MFTLSQLQDEVVRISKFLEEDEAENLIIAMRCIEQASYNKGLQFKATH